LKELRRRISQTGYTSQKEQIQDNYQEKQEIKGTKTENRSEIEITNSRGI